MRRARSLAAVLALAVAVAGCTNLYKPFSAWEESVFRKAAFDVYPDDVRRDPAKYAATLVAWAGTLENVVFDETVAPPVVRMTVRHRFFNWLMDGTTRRYWLSPAGEGSFTASWPLRPEWEVGQMRALILPGDMVIAYGYGRTIRDGVVDLGQAEYVRHVGRHGFRTDVLEYGRPGAPVRSLGLGLP